MDGQKERRRRWAFERLQNRRKPPPLVAPSQRPSSANTEELQSKSALNVAMATAAAAEAAVAAAQMAAEAFQLTKKAQIPTGNHHVKHNDVAPPPPVATAESPLKLKHGLETKIQEADGVQIKSAITIQSAFRGYLVSN